MYPSLSVDRLLSLAGSLSCIVNLAPRKAAILRVLHLQRVAHREMRFLSMGDQKKALIGMELMAASSNLLLDEPLKYLDTTSSRSLEAFLFFLEDSGQ